MEDLNELLRRGIAAAKAGQREQARDHLMRVVEQDEENTMAWLWLSGLVESWEDREVCLENVLSLDPDNEAARKGLDRLRQQSTAQWLQEGIAAAKAGQSEQARALLMRVAEQDAENITALLWLSGVVDDLDECQGYLEDVLSLDPNNDAARRGLVRLEEKRRAQQAQPTPVPESPVVARTRIPASPAAAMLREDFASRLPPPEPEPEPPPPPAEGADLNNEYLCPYCAVLTEPEDRKCKACGRDLWIKFRAREKRSTTLWILIGFQLFSTFQLAAIPVLVLGYVLVRVAMDYPGQTGISEPLPLLNAYLGLPTTLSPVIVEAAFDLVPRFVYYLSIIPFLSSAAVLAALFLRWKPVYYLFLADAVLELAVAFWTLIVGGNMVFGGIGLGFALVRIMLVFQIEEDFKWERRRLVLSADRGLGSGADFLIRGDFYAKQNMWGMAALHLERAISWMPHDVSSRTALIAAYLRLKRYDQATRLLAETRSMAPGDPRVDKLQTLLDEMRTTEATESAASSRPSI
jgi:tetratricopeptide (TPR) repeat protein